MSNPQTPYTKDSEQIVLNKSFDPTFNVLATQGLKYDGTNLVRDPAPLFTKPFDRLIVTYTDSTKTVISTAVTKLNGVTQETITNSYTSTVDDFARS